MQWEAYDRTRTLNWTPVPFASDNATRVPEVPGVYAFVLEHRVGRDMPASFPMYVGMSTTSIRDRYHKYQAQAFRGKVGRPRLDRLFQVWKGYLTFLYVTDLGGVAPPVLEERLNNALIPPMVKTDYSADVRRLIGAYS